MPVITFLILKLLWPHTLLSLCRGLLQLHLSAAKLSDDVAFETGTSHRLIDHPQQPRLAAASIGNFKCIRLGSWSLLPKSEE